MIEVPQSVMMTPRKEQHMSHLKGTPMGAVSEKKSLEVRIQAVRLAFPGTK